MMAELGHKLSRQLRHIQKRRQLRSWQRSAPYQGNDVMISGFGKWTVKAKMKRKGRNPKTGKEMMIEARKVVTFKSSNVLRGNLK